MFSLFSRFTSQSGGREMRSFPIVAKDMIDFVDDDDRQYWRHHCIDDNNRINRVFRDILDSQEWITLTGRSPQLGSPRTCLSKLDDSGRRIFLRRLADEASHAKLERDGHVNVTAMYQGSPLLFTLDLQVAISSGGETSYRAAYPDWLLSSQMRASFRIALPSYLMATLVFERAEVGQIKALVVDLSEGGMRIRLPKQAAHGLEVGTIIDAAYFFTRESDLGPLGLQVRYISGAASNQPDVGMAIIHSTEVQLQNIRRLVLCNQATAKKNCG